MLGAFLVLYCVLTLYGTSLLYKNVLADGCDPSGGVPDAADCPNTGAAVFGAMLGVAFAAQGVSQVGNVTEAFAQARVAVHEALVAMNRRPGSPEKVIYKTQEDVDELGSTTHSQSSRRSRDVEKGEEREIKAILPPFRIDATSSAGLTPKILGQISFRNVDFHYPTRPGDTVLNGITFDVEAGETVALVGASSNCRHPCFYWF
jgi:ABC-type multidrug transport system fused ATPase/permease subunit